MHPAAKSFHPLPDCSVHPVQQLPELYLTVQSLALDFSQAWCLKADPNYILCPSYQGDAAGGEAAESAYPFRHVMPHFARTCFSNSGMAANCRQHVCQNLA